MLDDDLIDLIRSFVEPLEDRILLLEAAVTGLQYAIPTSMREPYRVDYGPTCSGTTGLNVTRMEAT